MSGAEKAVPLQPQSSGAQQVIQIFHRKKAISLHMWKKSCIFVPVPQGADITIRQ